MQDFLKTLRQTLNHLSDENHAAFHKEIEAAAKRHFSDVNDDLIEDWLQTEEMHCRDFPPKESVSTDDPFRMSAEDLRADTERTMFGTIEYIVKSGKYTTKLEAFRKDMEPKLKGLELRPTYTIADLGTMPWDGAHVFHVVMRSNLFFMSPELKGEKLFTKRDIDEYMQQCGIMDQYYWTLGGEPFESSLKSCNEQIQSMYAKAGRSRKEIAQAFREVLDKLVASL